MNFTIEELKNEGKNNIEIVELCDKYLKEIEKNIKNLNNMLILVRGQEKYGDENNKQLNLSNIKTLLVLSKKGEETDEKTVERLIEEAKEEKEEIIKRRQDSLELIGNIIEICADDLECIYNYKKGIKIERPNNDKQFASLMNRNSEIQKKLKSYEKYGKFLTENNKKEILNLIKEKAMLEIELGQVLPNVDEEVKYIRKKEKIEKLASNEEILKEYENIAEELNDFLQNDKEDKERSMKTDKSELKQEKPEEINIIPEENTNQIQQEESTETIKQIEKKIKRIRSVQEVNERKEKFREKLELMIQEDLNKKNNIGLEYSERTK